MSHKIERRTQEIGEIRAIETDGERTIAGHAAVFDKFSQNLGGFVEKISRGAFTESLAKRDIRALWSHNPDYILGRTGNRTLRLWEDDYGLGFELKLPDTQLGRDTYTSIARGDVSGMSFGFRVMEHEWKKSDGTGPHQRTLTKVDLFEVSPTAFPAYEATDVSARSLADLVNECEAAWRAEADLWNRLAEAEGWRPRIWG